MNWFGPVGDCGCCEAIPTCDDEVESLTIASSHACMQDFVGTWAVLPPASKPAAPAGCQFDCYDFAGASIASPADCSFGGFTYRASLFGIYIFRFNNGNVWLRMNFNWSYSQNPTLTAFLGGRMFSSDGGATFGTFEQDAATPGCSAPTSDSPPTDGSDIVCSLIMV